MLGAETFFKIEVFIFGCLICAGLLIWGLRLLTKEICDWYEELQERRSRWRERYRRQDIGTTADGVEAARPIHAAPR